MNWGLYLDDELMSKHDTCIEALNAAVFAYQENSIDHEVKLIEQTEAAYKKQAKNQIGETLKDQFCNGFFGSRNFDLEDATITKIYDSDEDNAIVIEVQYKNGKYDYGYFTESYREWQAVANYLEEWIMGEQ